MMKKTKEKGMIEHLSTPRQQLKFYGYIGLESFKDICNLINERLPGNNIIITMIYSESCYNNERIIFIKGVLDWQNEPEIQDVLEKYFEKKEEEKKLEVKIKIMLFPLRKRR